MNTTHSAGGSQVKLNGLPRLHTTAPLYRQFLRLAVMDRDVSVLRWIDYQPVARSETAERNLPFRFAQLRRADVLTRVVLLHDAFLIREKSTVAA